MQHRSALVAAASAQLAAQAVGHVVALRRRHSFDVPFLTGSAEHVVRDWLWFGTAYSAPPYILGPQAWAIARLVRGPDERARQVLRIIGTSVIAGYLSERLCRLRLTPGGFDPVETPVVVVGLGGVLAMAVLGRPRSGQADGRP
jgi:hypothetical protein